MRNRATSRDVERRGTTPPSSGNGLVWPPSLTRRPTGTPAHRRHATDRMLAWPGGLRLRLGRRSIHLTQTALACWCGGRWLPAELDAGGLGQVAERLVLAEEDHRPVLQVQRGGGMVGVDANCNGRLGWWARRTSAWGSQSSAPRRSVCRSRAWEAPCWWVGGGRGRCANGPAGCADPGWRWSRAVFGRRRWRRSGRVGDGLRGRLRLLTMGWGGHGRAGRRGSRCGPGRAL
jgi:hypothetical protein